MELLLHLSRRVAEASHLDDVLRTIVSTAAVETQSDRGTLFLNDENTGELYSRFAQGARMREIRILNTDGIAGHVFTSGEPLIIPDAYQDPRFDQGVDKETGYVTRNLMCTPIRVRGSVIGVLEVINRKRGSYTAADLRMLEAITSQTAATLRSMQLVERMKVSRKQEMEFLDLVARRDRRHQARLAAAQGHGRGDAHAQRRSLHPVPQRREDEASCCPRSAMGARVGEIRLPNHLGIAGAVFTSGKTINIPYAYADLRFNPAFDKKTGFFTRSILCVPIVNKPARPSASPRC